MNLYKAVGVGAITLGSLLFGRAGFSEEADKNNTQFRIVSMCAPVWDNIEPIHTEQHRQFILL